MSGRHKSGSAYQDGCVVRVRSDFTKQRIQRTAGSGRPFIDGPNTLEPRSPFKIRVARVSSNLARQVAVVTSVPPGRA